MSSTPEHDRADRPPAWRRLRDRLTRVVTGRSLAAALVLGGVGGIVFWGGFNTAMEATNSLAFCTSCHEMRDTVGVEYRQTIHFANLSGVRAICSDCHVPRDWGHKVARKVQAAGEVYGWLVGSIDTPAKFEARRADLARRVWQRMKASDSIECRNCHATEAMSAERQTERARLRHHKGVADGRTCIDCHYGIAHQEPAGPGPQELFGQANTTPP